MDKETLFELFREIHNAKAELLIAKYEQKSSKRFDSYNIAIDHLDKVEQLLDKVAAVIFQGE